MSELVTLAIDEEGVALVTMQDAAGKNAFGHAFVEQLEGHLEAASDDESVKVIVLRGLPEVFCAGGDFEVLLALAEGGMTPYDLVLTRRVLASKVPVIAAMEGPAVGGGLVFGLACDIVLMDAKSRYGLNFMDMGFTPGMGATRVVQAALGEHLAAEMLFGTQYFKGSHFEGRSLVNYVLPKDKVFKKAMKVAGRIADKPRFAVSLLKRTLSLPRRKAFEESLTLESMMHDICFLQPGTRERIRETYTRISGDES